MWGRAKREGNLWIAVKGGLTHIDWFRTLLGAPGLTTRSKDATRNKCIATSNKCLTGKNKDATRGSCALAKPVGHRKP